jgi:hypothetical protein
MTRYNWDTHPSAGSKRKGAEESLNENASKYCIVVVIADY